MEIQNTTTPLVQKASKKEAIKNLVVILLVVFGAYAITAWVGVDRLQYLAEAAGLWGIALIVILKITTIIFVPLGGGPIYPIAGAVYGFVPGFLLTFIGDIIGFTIAFYISRRYGESVIKLFIPNDEWPVIDRVLEKGSHWKTLLKARILFAAVPEIFAYAAGLSKAHYIPFIAIMMVIQIPGSILLTLFGDLLLSGDLRILIPVAIIGGGIVFISGLLLHRDITKD